MAWRIGKRLATAFCVAVAACAAVSRWRRAGAQAKDAEFGLGADERLGAVAAPRQLLGAEATTCGTDFPIRGIQYVPHIVGEPYPHPQSNPDNVYSKQFRLMYERDLPLMRQLGVDTVRLRPWGGHSHDDRDHFKYVLRKTGMCNAIPTFQMAKHYSEMIRDQVEQPDTGTNAALHKDFIHFAADVERLKRNSNPDGTPDGLNILAWSVDVSLDLENLMPLMTDCAAVPSSTTEDGKAFNRYVTLLKALVTWVQGGQQGSSAPSLQNAALLIPLDISRIPITRNYEKAIQTFIGCMPKWAPQLFEGTGKGTPRWLLSFSLPRDSASPYPFKGLLNSIATQLRKNKQRAVVMVADQSLAPDPGNPNTLCDLDNKTSPPTQQYDLQNAYKDYKYVADHSKALDGFILDEWQDDWDRGVRGPFFLALSSIHEMRQECVSGGRFSHDETRCNRRVGSGWVYPEWFGMAKISSVFWTHCSTPKFHKGLFSFLGDGTNVADWGFPLQCRRVLPAWQWETLAAVMIGVVMILQLFESCTKVCSEGDVSDEEPEDEMPAEDDPEYVGYVRIDPTEPRLRGGHVLEMSSKRMRNDAEVGWWLHSHMTTQMGTLEKQLAAELNAQRAVRDRRRHLDSQSDDSDADMSDADSELDSVLGSDDSDLLARSMEVLHSRCLEGFAMWCSYVAGGFSSPSTVDKDTLKSFADMVTKNQGRNISRLFAECLLLRTMESIGEQLICCPERLSFLFYKIVAEAGGPDEEGGPSKYVIDFEELQDGLPQMQHHSNPYIAKKMQDGTWARGLNFDDINESGIQCRERVAKTYNEPASWHVIIDSILCYRVPIMMKIWTMMVAFYIYLGSARGNDITTMNNGEWYWPQWIRMNFIQWSAMIDAASWIVMEVLYIVYFTWQRFPSLGYRSPGLPTCLHTLEHVLNMCFSGAGLFWVVLHMNFAEKPALCAQTDLDQCVDPRASLKMLPKILSPAIGYWAVRMLVFFVMNRRRFPIFILGSSGNPRFRQGKFQTDVLVNAIWALMLGTCIFAEVCFIFPSVRGMDLNSLCGLQSGANMYGLPPMMGKCSAKNSKFTFDCVSCVTSVATAQMLVFLTCLVDIYFVFYIYSAIVGSVMGQRRFLNDLKNTGVPIDLRPGVGREARLFEEVFGPDWQRVWCAMLHHLLDESYVSPKQAEGLAAAARCSLDSLSCVASKDAKREKPINLKKFNHIAGERLAFFFHSLKSIKTPSGPSRGTKFIGETDALTGKSFDIGSVPTLTMIIPAYNETVIPSSAFLRDGALREDATNQNPDGQVGVGDPTLPPVGDGVNSNLAFIVSQFPDEWIYLAEMLHQKGMTEDPSSHRLYKRFMIQALTSEVEDEVRIWAMLRTQSVGRTVVGALQYGRALEALPAIKQYYAQRPDKRIPEDHMEVILCHQTYGNSDGDPDNDKAVRMLLSRNANASVFLVFDLTPSSGNQVKNLVDEYLNRHGGYGVGAFKHASVKCRWNPTHQDVEIVSVLPRQFPLRLGSGDCKTQGKACNQLNGLRFATGHYCQALDCNMGVFIGEGFKVPYVLRNFMPLDRRNRTAPKCRYLGFREFIFTGREGTVGKCHASAEWTFGTIYQRFLSGMGTRMHYGHPDFVDGFWVRNRGGMSKSSPVVNLSEDIFAGYNVRMREENSPHVDSLEFEKGRESTFNSASNFFAKISGGSIAVIRSRDNHLLCEKIGLAHGWSFYFTSVAFYTSNLFIDMSIYLYVLLFIAFTLADIDLAKLHELGSTFQTEWVMSMGMFSLFPQLLEMVLEFGAMRAFREVLGMLPAATFFFIFQNKNIASALRNGIATGIAKYFFTGRPMANQHQTWRDIYVTYWKSHYKPAFSLMTAYIIYQVLVHQTFQGALPMVLVVISFSSWLVTPIIFSPFPRWPLIEQDIREFSAFLNGTAGKEEEELPEVVKRGSSGKVRTLWECGLANEISTFLDSTLWLCVMTVVLRVIGVCFMMLIIPAEILDFLWIFILVWSINLVLIRLYLISGQNNLLLHGQTVVWLLCVPLGQLVLGSRAVSPTVITRLPELVIAFTIFAYFLGLAKDTVLTLNKVLLDLRVMAGGSKTIAERHHNQFVRKCFLYFQVHQFDMAEAYFIIIANTAVSLILMLVDRLFFNVHTWWLLNREMGRTAFDGQYLAKSPPQIESDQLRDGTSIGTNSELGLEDSFQHTPTQAGHNNHHMSATPRPLLQNRH